MKLRYKILNGVLLFVVVGLLSLGITLSYTTECGLVPAPPEDVPLMKAVTARCYGSADVLQLEKIEKPTVTDNDVLVKVHAAAVNPLDWHYMRGKPYMMRMMGVGIGAPNDIRVGVDFAGTVEAVGRKVTRFKPGDEVFGGRGGAFAEYVLVPEDRAVALKPDNVTFEQAASVGIAAITALQGLRDHGQIEAGQKVLINGASGGVGTFAVQIAKSFGAEVSGVCSTRNLELVRSLGADHVIDYTKENFTESDKRYDLILDNVGNHSLLDVRRALEPDGTLVIIGGPKNNQWVGPMMRPIKAFLLSPFVSQDMGMLLAQLTQDDLTILAELMQSGEVTPIIGRRYSLDEVPTAMTYSEEGHARGKIIINTVGVEE